MRAKKPSEKLPLGTHGRVVATIVDEAVKAAAEKIGKTIRARRRQLVKRGTRPEVLELWNTIICEFHLRASRGYTDLWLLLQGRGPEATEERVSLFKEAGALIKEDGLNGYIDPGASMLESHGVGYQVRFRWS